jgi:uncharacterized protein YjbJ (UPF0337 family)
LARAHAYVHETKGAVKEKLHATNNPALEDKGTDEKVAGKVPSAPEASLLLQPTAVKSFSRL